MSIIADEKTIISEVKSDQAGFRVNGAKKNDLSDIARIIRIKSLLMIAKAGSGHPGGSLSLADIMAVLFFQEMNFNPQKRWDANRDRFILSKGHAAPALYAVLNILGIIDDEHLQLLRRFDGILEGHPAKDLIPGVEMSTGSLGQGLSVAIGLSLAARLDQRSYRSYVVLGDGEIQEGMVWEAAMAAAHYKLDNLCAFIDHNGLQIDGQVSDIMSVDPIAAKFLAFGWHVQTIDGHDISEISAALNKARNVKNQPSVIVANTVKGKGVSFMEGKFQWHGVAPNADELQIALQELRASEF